MKPTSSITNLKQHIIALGAACLLGGCSASTGRPGVPETPGCAVGEALPSRSGFLQEVLFAVPSMRTPRFDDYTGGSYHINKLDLAEGLPEQARLCGARVKALIVVGPLGPLWSFNVAALLHERAGYRVNALVMPHARITGKGTGFVSATEADAMLDELTRASLVRPGLPTPEPRDMRSDFSYRMLLAIYDGDRPRFFHADFKELSEQPAREELLLRVNAVLATAKTSTYKHGDSVR